MPSVFDQSCTTTQLKAHVTKRLVFYRFHPWYGREVSVISSMTRREIATFRCSLPEDPLEKFYDIPQWMFDEAFCLNMKPSDQAAVSVFGLRSLAQCIVELQASAAATNTYFQNGDVCHETTASQTAVPDATICSSGPAPPTQGATEADSKRNSQ